MYFILLTLNLKTAGNTERTWVMKLLLIVCFVAIWICYNIVRLILLLFACRSQLLRLRWGICSIRRLKFTHGCYFFVLIWFSPESIKAVRINSCSIAARFLMNITISTEILRAIQKIWINMNVWPLVIHILRFNLFYYTLLRFERLILRRSTWLIVTIRWYLFSFCTVNCVYWAFFFSCNLLCE